MTTLPVADARAQLSKLIDEAATTHERFEITRNGHRAATLGESTWRVLDARTTLEPT